MKKMKKALSLILAVIMLLSVVPLQIFAIGPTLEKIEFSNNAPVSNQDIQNKVSYYGNIDESTRVQLENINYGDYEYTYKLYFSNGTIIDTVDFYWNPVGVDYIGIYSEVSPLECQKAIEEGLPTVNVDVKVTLEKTFGQNEVYEFQLQKGIVEGIVRNVRLADTMPTDYDEEYPEPAFYGKKFELEYFDSSKEVLEFVYDKEDDIGYIDDNFVSFRFYITEETDDITGEKIYFKNIDIKYLDVVSSIMKEKVVCPYESIEILDYKFDGKGGITKISYRLTYTDGRTVDRTCSFKKGIGSHGDDLVEIIDGYEVLLQTPVDDFGGTEFQLRISIGYYEWGIHDVVYGEAKDCCNCICHGTGLKYLISLFMLRIWAFFRINQECRCSSWHW